MRAHARVRHLEWRVRLFGAGAILGVAGMATDMRWLVGVAIGVLAVGFLIRFLPERAEKDGGARPHDA